MALKALVDSLEKVAEAIRGEYVEVKDGPNKGKFLLGVESVSGFGLEDVSSLKTALSVERRDAETLSAKLKAFGDMTPEKARDALDRVEKGIPEAAKEQAKKLAEEQIGQFKSSFEKQLADANTKVAKAYESLSSNALSAAGTAALAKAKGNPKLLYPHLKSRAKVAVDDAGNVKIEFLDEKGNALITTKQGATDAMGAEEFVDKVLRSEFPEGFEGHGNTGSGASGSSGNPSTSGGKQEPWQITLEQAQTPRAYSAAADAAMAAGKGPIPTIL